jgi:hypothetical protein
MADRFGKAEITVTMLGEEWFALIARTIGRSLSPEGAKLYNRAASKIQEQLTAASEAHKNSENEPPAYPMGCDTLEERDMDRE